MDPNSLSVEHGGDVYLTPREAAAHLKLSPVTLAQWRSKDRGPSYCKLGAAVRYRRSDLDAWAASQRVAAGDTLKCPPAQLAPTAAR